MTTLTQPLRTGSEQQQPHPAEDATVTVHAVDRPTPSYWVRRKRDTGR